MATTPTRPDERQEVDPETERQIRDRDAIFDEQYQRREDADKAIQDIRRSLKPLEVSLLPIAKAHLLSTSVAPTSGGPRRIRSYA